MFLSPLKAEDSSRPTKIDLSQLISETSWVRSARQAGQAAPLLALASPAWSHTLLPWSMSVFTEGFSQ